MEKVKGFTRRELEFADAVWTNILHSYGYGDAIATRYRVERSGRDAGDLLEIRFHVFGRVIVRQIRISYRRNMFKTTLRKLKAELKDYDEWKDEEYERRRRQTETD